MGFYFYACKWSRSYSYGAPLGGISGSQSSAINIIECTKCTYAVHPWDTSSEALRSVCADWRKTYHYSKSSLISLLSSNDNTYSVFLNSSSVCTVYDINEGKSLRQILGDYLVYDVGLTDTRTVNYNHTFLKDKEFKCELPFFADWFHEAWWHTRWSTKFVGYFTVVCLVTWPWMQAMLEMTRSLCFSHLNANQLA